MIDRTGISDEAREEARRILRDDFVVYPQEALTIINAVGEPVRFVLKRPQVRLARGLMAQRAAGQPMRAVILKARKVGFSTQTQGMLVQRATQIPVHYALVVAQDTRTAGEIFGIGRRMWAALPGDVKPEIAYERNSRGGQKFMQFGEPSLLARRSGQMGLDSTIEISTARDVDAGRGLTIRSLHLSEVAFWPYQDKLLGLLNAVPDDPDTLIIWESTANGHNFFKDAWDRAVSGESGYIGIFTPWFEEEAYQRPFLDEIDRQRFVDSIGTGKWGEDEPALLELMVREIPRLADEAGMPLTQEELDGLRDRCYRHLAWRRWCIAAKCDSDLDKFHQEYPATAEEAFLSTGRRVFKVDAVSRVIARCRETDPATPTVDCPGPARGGFVAEASRKLRAARGVTIEAPVKVAWTPAKRLPEDVRAHWEVWEAPQQEYVDDDGKRHPAGQYVISCDPMSGEENEGVLANHAIQVINHRTLQQAAQYESQADPDQVALELLMAALHYNGALIVVEVTGGWGTSIVQRLARDYRYARMYERDVAERRTAKRQERLGWSTDVKTKPLLIDRLTELLRDDVDGICSARLAGQLLTYIRDERGRTMPEAGKLADLLMAYAIAQTVAGQRPLRSDRNASRTTSAGAVGAKTYVRAGDRE